MNQALPLVENTISDIFLDNGSTQTFQIPIYQRNYAWEEEQIYEIVKDIKDSLDNHPHSPYYIGTLVTYKRDEGNFEVIDGQQRLTTLLLLLKAIGEKLQDATLLSLRNKLTYRSREKSAKTLQLLPNLVEDYDIKIKEGYEFASHALDEYTPSHTELTVFKNYLLHKVILIHYTVPKDVDLNHYFEVMNSRGEQLEKHEIVKSLLYGTLDSEEERQTFSKIWDACAHMGSYIQHFLGDSAIFSNNSSVFVAESFEDLKLTDDIFSQESILKMMHCVPSKINNDIFLDDEDKFLPVIDFPNFLLIVLKITLFLDNKLDIKTFQLDDKELLKEFNENLEIYKSEAKSQEFVRKFAFNLLKSKYFLDNYMVHHSLRPEEEGQNPWELEKYYKSGNETTTKNLADGEVQTELVHLLSMFETSFTPKTRKNYLFYILILLFENTNVKDYLKFLQSLANKYFYDIYLCKDCLNERNVPRPDIFDSLIVGTEKNLCLDIVNSPNPTPALFNEIYPLGNANISLFVFNFTDYKIWKKYASALRGEKLRESSPERRIFFESLGCSDFKLDSFNRFYFSRTRKSLEHFYPQSNALQKEMQGDDTPTVNEINCFGNFAMIGADANSSGSNWSPAAKCDHYNSKKLNKVSVASLKFKIMMQMCEDNLHDQSGSLNKESAWLYKDIKKHQQQMLDIILDIV